MHKVKVKFKKDQPVYADGIYAEHFKIGDEAEFTPELAAALVNEGIADEKGDNADLLLNSKKSAEDKGITANEANPDYGTRDHEELADLAESEEDDGQNSVSHKSSHKKDDSGKSASKAKGKG